jgi:hypothetical protein
MALEMVASDSAPMEAASPEAKAADAASVGELIAYSYQRAVEVPFVHVRSLLEQHARACRDAGAAVCLIEGSNTYSQGENHIVGNLTVRATPAWIEAFLGGLESEVTGLKGRVTSANQTAENLTRQITDSEARLRALKTLRERLTALLADRPGRLADLLELERELARVQGEIDAYESMVAVMRERVSRSALTVSYTSAPVAFSEDAWEPLKQAFNDFAVNAATAFGMLITLVAVLLPWVVVVGGLIWLGVWFVRRRNPPTAG